MTRIVPESLTLRNQSGQAAAEALVVLLALAVLWAGTAWLGRIQDLALQTSHASRHGAFLAARQDHDMMLDMVTTGSLQGPANQWSDFRGHALQRSVYTNVQVDLQRRNGQAVAVPDTEADQRIAQLEEDWLNTDLRVLSVRVTLAPSTYLSEPKEGSLLQLHQFDAAYPSIRRQTSILTGAGHSGNDRLVADRVAGSAMAWSEASDQSYRLGQRIASVANRIDGGWNRPQPVFDWLYPWADYVPDHHLLQY